MVASAHGAGLGSRRCWALGSELSVPPGGEQFVNMSRTVSEYGGTKGGEEFEFSSSSRSKAPTPPFCLRVQVQFNFASIVST